MVLDELLNHIFEGESHALSARFEGWALSSRRFRAFAETYRDKIRKKRRIADDEEKLLDLLFELETAYLLLQDTRFAVEYENRKSSGGRGPDFTIAFRVNTRFNVEVTRIRAADTNPAGDSDLLGSKFVSAVCDKLGQMPPSVINVLVIGMSGRADGDDLARAMADLRLRAERKDEACFTRRGFKSASDFLRQFRRLSGIILRGQPGCIWQNSLAKHPIPTEVQNALRKAMFF